MTANISPISGIAYGYISANALNSDLVHELMYGSQAVDLSYAEAVRELRAELNCEADAIEEDVDDAMHDSGEANLPDATRDAVNDSLCEAAYLRRGYGDREAFIEGELDNRASFIEIEEPQVEGTYEGVSYASSHLGGALNFFVLDSPHTTDKARRASPCVQNAGILDTCDGNVTAYDIPTDWRHE